MAAGVSMLTSAVGVVLKETPPSLLLLPLPQPAVQPALFSSEEDFRGSCATPVAVSLAESCVV